MSIIPVGLLRAGADLGAAIAQSCRFNDGDAPELSLAYTLSAPWTFSAWVKRCEIDAENLMLGAAAGEIHFNADNTLEAEGVSSTAEFPDTTGWMHIHVSDSGLYVNGVSHGSVTTTNLTNAKLFDDFDGYVADVHLQSGTRAVTEFGRFSTTHPEVWVPKSATAGEHHLTFSNSADLGENSGSGSDWAAAGLTADDQVTDTPTNNHATLNPRHDNAAGLLSDGNLTVAGGAEHQLGTIGMASGRFTWQVTAGSTESQSHGVEAADGTETLYTASFNAADAIQFRFDADAGTLDRKLNAGAWTSVATGLTAAPYFPLVKGNCTVDFGQTGFTGADAGAGCRLLNTAGLAKPAVDRPGNHFVAVLDSEADIAASLAAARAGWPSYVEILKNRDSAETWAWRFSHDSGNEYAVSATATHQTSRTLAGTDGWVGYALRVGTGIHASAVSHTAGSDTTVTDGLGTARKLILVFPRAGGDVWAYHPDLTAGSLLKLNSDAAETANTAIDGVTADAFDLGAGLATGTYDVLAVAETSGLARLFRYTGNAGATNIQSHCGFSPALLVVKRATGGNGRWNVEDSAREPYSVGRKVLVANTDAAEITHPVDLREWFSTGHGLIASDIQWNAAGAGYVWVALAREAFGGGQGGRPALPPGKAR